MPTGFLPSSLYRLWHPPDTIRDMLTIHVGCHELTLADARKIVTTYTSRRDLPTSRKDTVFAWPYYDGMTTGSGPNELNDGDLLAPALLNADPGIRGFATLQGIRGNLELRISSVRSDLDLAEATDSDIAAVASLFEPLGTDGLFGVKGTILSKVLHRKRPRLVPLYDHEVFKAYRGDRVERTKSRSWADYVTRLMQEMQKDLQRAPEAWRDLQSLPPAGSPALTQLRALDILAWTLG